MAGRLLLALRAGPADGPTLGERVPHNGTKTALTRLVADGYVRMGDSGSFGAGLDSLTSAGRVACPTYRSLHQ